MSDDKPKRPIGRKDTLGRHRGTKMERKRVPMTIQQRRQRYNYKRQYYGSGEKIKASRFGAALRLLRERRGLSRKALAEMVGCHENYLFKLEHGHRKTPSPELVENLIRVLPSSELGRMDLRIASGVYVWCPHCGHSFAPTQENVTGPHEEETK